MKDVTTCAKEWTEWSEWSECKSFEKNCGTDDECWKNGKNCGHIGKKFKTRTCRFFPTMNPTTGCPGSDKETEKFYR